MQSMVPEVLPGRYVLLVASLLPAPGPTPCSQPPAPCPGILVAKHDTSSTSGMAVLLPLPALFVGQALDKGRLSGLTLTLMFVGQVLGKGWAEWDDLDVDLDVCRSRPGCGSG